MESSPDLQPTVERDIDATTPPRPTLLRNMVFWLLTMLLGLVLLLLLPVLTAGNRDRHSYDFHSYHFLLLAAGLATILSLVALSLMLPLLRQALTAPSAELRWLRVFTLQSLSLGGLTALGYLLAGGSDHDGFGGAAPLVGTIYFVAGLLAAVAVYWPWLRRP